MPSEKTWTEHTSSLVDLTAPALLTDANVVSNSNILAEVSFSCELTAGTSPTVTLELYWWNPVSSSFQKTGDSFALNPASANLYVVQPAGVTLGYATVSTGSPTNIKIYVGV